MCRSMEEKCSVLADNPVRLFPFQKGARLLRHLFLLQSFPTSCKKDWEKENGFQGERAGGRARERALETEKKREAGRARTRDRDN